MRQFCSLRDRIRNCFKMENQNEYSENRRCRTLVLVVNERKLLLLQYCTTIVRFCEQAEFCLNLYPIVTLMQPFPLKPFQTLKRRPSRFYYVEKQKNIRGGDWTRDLLRVKETSWPLDYPNFENLALKAFSCYFLTKNILITSLVQWFNLPHPFHPPPTLKYIHKTSS